MRVSYHPEFPKDIKRFEAQYREVSPKLAARFRTAADAAIERVKASPGSAGHFVNTGSSIVRDVRRCNLSSFPFFILYGLAGDLLVFRSIIPSASDPLTWLNRLSAAPGDEPADGGVC
ncbi:conserved hypothetical protein [Verrucomicrobia bacterium]|nr:conserved hypothetical protein [Verrucomicrobiota bacterium]